MQNLSLGVGGHTFAVLIFVFLVASPCIMAATTDPSKIDSDGDGYWDGPDVLKDMGGSLVWRIGEDKNANGRYEPKGQDGVWETQDDEFDPANPTSHPTCNQIYSYTEIASWHDADGDGLTDEQEDKNLNGVYEPNGTDGIAGTEDDETNFRDADTDDDGLSDGFEAGFAPDDYLPFWNAQNPLKPNNPDSDGDGSPDGLELGVSVDPTTGLPLTLNAGIKTAYRVIPQQNPYADGRFTDTDATFMYNGQPRKCFIKDEDPATITDPTKVDSNFDGVTDNASDLNFNGKQNPGETDAAAGFASALIWGTPDRFYDEPDKEIYYIAPVYVNTVNEVASNDSGIYEFLFQSASDDNFSEQSISSIELENPSDPTALSVKNIQRLVPGKNIWKVSLQWNHAANQPTKVRVNTPKTTTPKQKIQPQPAAKLSPLTCDYEHPTPPNFGTAQAIEIEWKHITPYAHPLCWNNPDLLWGVGEIMNRVNTALKLIKRQEDFTKHETDINTFLTGYYGVGQSQPSEQQYERQWLMAMLYAEVGSQGYTTDNDKYKWQHEMILEATVPLAQYAYVAGRQKAKRCLRWTRRPTPSDYAGFGRINRLYDILDSGFYGTVPHNKAKSAQNHSWVALMDFRDGIKLSEEAGTAYEPQWKMKSLVNMEYWYDSNGNGIDDRSKKYSECNSTEKSIFLGYIYLSALFARMALDGNCYIQATGSNPAYIGKTWERLDENYSRRGKTIPDNRKPAINHDPNLTYKEYKDFNKEEGLPEELIGNTAIDPSPYNRKDKSANEVYRDSYLRIRTSYPEKYSP